MVDAVPPSIVNPPADALISTASTPVPADERTRLAACAPVCAMVKLSPAPFAA